MSLAGANISLRGNVQLDASGKVMELNGDIRLVSNPDLYVGNFSLMGVNINDREYVQYRTEASQLVDQAVSEINNETATINE